MKLQRLCAHPWGEQRHTVAGRRQEGDEDRSTCLRGTWRWRQFAFDIKLDEGFRRKARLVALGNRTKTPSALTYSSVVARDSVRITLTAAALIDLDILVCDIEGAYWTAKCREKVYVEAGPEFGSDRQTSVHLNIYIYIQLQRLHWSSHYDLDFVDFVDFVNYFINFVTVVNLVTKK